MIMYKVAEIQGLLSIFFLTAKLNLVIENVLLNRKLQRLSIQLRMI